MSGKIKLLTVLLVAIALFVCELSAQKKDRNKIAVHNFTIAKELTQQGLNGWLCAGKMESELVKNGYYRVMTRAQIAKVLKERNMDPETAISPDKLGKILGAEFIVTGQIDKTDRKVTVICKLIDVKKDAGEIKRSLQSSYFVPVGSDSLYQLEFVFAELAEKLSMSPGDTLAKALSLLKIKDYYNSLKLFRQLENDSGYIELLKSAEIEGETKVEPDLKKKISSWPVSQTFDYAFSMLPKDKKQAGAVIAWLEKNKFKKTLSSLRETVDTESRKQREDFNSKISEARKNFAQALKAKGDQSHDQCADLISELRSLLVDPDFPMTRKEKYEIEQTIYKIEGFRMGQSGGPKVALEWTIPETDMVLMPIKAGSFMMGAAVKDKDEEADNPLHQVTFSNSFWISKMEITINDCVYFLQQSMLFDKAGKGKRDNEINFDNKNCPIDRDGYKMKRGKGRFWGSKKQPINFISWKGARYFCEWLNMRERKAKRLPAGYVYRLPTEAEWEYCLKAGNKGIFAFGNDEKQLTEYAWCKANSNNKTHPVGRKKANSWGLHDMNGNLWEWCEDWYDGAYANKHVVNPIGPETSSENLKVIRGGGYSSVPLDLMAAARTSFPYRSSKKSIGFRIVLAPEL